MRAPAGLFAGLLALGIVACGGAGTPPVQVAPTAPASESPAAAPAASPAGTTDPDAQDEYDYDY